ncbi:unnamed protein product [Danaus chrysippus]|uniref:(African queen) hypothetical protein n=1 Tax=Danaus chrysippus TaxID=151541 RepID=A0A8J2QEL6_9NEOP|nr:unnamed protein product [Danaus chrysippus]
MKAITAMCATGASVPAIASGRVQRHRDGENAEIQMYLSKLQDLVPFMPKNRRISKLEVIQHVIDYICDLQSALENHPAVGQFEAEAALAPTCTSPPKPRRRPLGPRPAPNTILPTDKAVPSHHSNHTVSVTYNISKPRADRVGIPSSTVGRETAFHGAIERGIERCVPQTSVTNIRHADCNNSKYAAVNCSSQLTAPGPHDTEMYRRVSQTMRTHLLSLFITTVLRVQYAAFVYNP